MPARMRCFPQFKLFWLPAVVGELKPNRFMGINYRFPIPHIQQVHGHPPQVPPLTHSDLCAPTAYATVFTHLALGSPLCRFMLVNGLISRSGNSNGSCPKVVYEEARALHAYNPKPHNILMNPGSQTSGGPHTGSRITGSGSTYPPVQTTAPC